MKRYALARAMAAALIASTMLAGLANASGGGGGGHGDSGEAAEGEEGAQTTARSMDAPYLAVPVVRDGRLVNYLFVSIRVEISPSVDLWRTRERAQFLRDALVRASHAHDLSDPQNNNAVNEARAIQVYRAAAVQALGEQAVAGVSVTASYSSQGSGI